MTRCYALVKVVSAAAYVLFMEDNGMVVAWQPRLWGYSVQGCGHDSHLRCGVGSEVGNRVDQDITHGDQGLNASTKVVVGVTKVMVTMSKVVATIMEVYAMAASSRTAL